MKTRSESGLSAAQLRILVGTACAAMTVPLLVLRLAFLKAGLPYAWAGVSLWIGPLVFALGAACCYAAALVAGPPFITQEVRRE